MDSCMCVIYIPTFFRVSQALGQELHFPSDNAIKNASDIAIYQTPIEPQKPKSCA